MVETSNHINTKKITIIGTAPIYPTYLLEYSHTVGELYRSLDLLP